MSIDSLRFERQKRLDELTVLDAEQGRILYRPLSPNDDWEKKIDKRCADRTLGRHFDPGAYETETDLADRRTEWESHRQQLRQEIEIIEKLLNKRLSMD
jgi:hypothetical protein